MKILIINYEFPPLGGGAATASYYIARELVRMGDETVVITSHFKNLPRQETQEGVRIIRLPVWRRRIDRCSVPEMVTFMISSCFIAVPLVKKLKAEAMLVFFGIPCGHVGLLAKWLYGTPYTVSLRGGDVPGSMERQLAFYHSLAKPLTKLIWKKARFVVANSEGLLELATRTIPELPFQLIPNGVDTEWFTPSERKTRSRIKILFAGRLNVEKDLPTMLRATDLLVKSGREIEVQIVGDGPERERLVSMVKQMGLLDVVNFRGWVDRSMMRTIYSEADILVLPSIDEGMSNVVLEAMASGMPVVVTRIRGNVDLVEDGVNGLLFEPGDVNALKSLLEKVLDEKLRHKMGEKARKKAEQYSWRRTAEKYHDLLLKC